VTCAVDMQRELLVRNGARPEPERLIFRVGVPPVR
jgi:hypothetical protein